MMESASNICPVTATINFPFGPPVVLHCAKPLGHEGSHMGRSTEEGPMTSGRWVTWADEPGTELANVAMEES